MCRRLVRAAHLDTLLAAIDLRKQPVVFALIGGGFANPTRAIWDAMLWAIDRVTPSLRPISPSP